MFASRTKHAVAWIALIAVLYSAATPVLAALRDGGSGGYFGALCTLAGIKPAPGQPSDPSIPSVPPGGETARQQHCLFCVSGAWQPPLDVSLTLPVPDATGMVASRAGESISPSTAASLQPLSPRAPPSLA